MKSIDTAIKHIEKRHKQFNGVITTGEVLSMLRFMKQAEDAGQVMVGVSFERYDGINYVDTPNDKLYNGGFAVL